MVKQQCLFGTLLSIKVPGRHFLVPESWRKGVKMTEPNRQSGEKEERIIEIEIERLRPFKEHPFQVKDDKEMFLLQESIEKYGILNPLIVRPVPDGYYEIISGHSRKHAAEKLGYRKVPVIIRVLSEDDSILSMVDSNLHRERISYSEKAFAYKLKNDVLKRKSGRKKSQVDHKTPRKRSIDIISEDCGDSPKQVQRYISLTKLIPEMLQKLDDEIISFCPAVEIAALKENEQSLEVTHHDDMRQVDEIVNLIVETVMCKNDKILIASNWYPASLVKKKFLMLTYSHIEYVLHCMRGNTTKVKNIKKYLLAALFNAPSTMNGYYQAEVNHDMPGLVR